MGRHRRNRSARVLVIPALSVLGLVAVIDLVVVVGLPMAGRGDAAQRSDAGPHRVSAAETMAPSTPLASVSFNGTPAVGALFSMEGDRLTGHFCTASVVDSPTRNLLITAAHCVSGARRDGRRVAFVPGLYDGTRPFGVWTVTKIIVDRDWVGGSDPDHDVAFLTVAENGGSDRIQDRTGANRLATGRPSGVVQVIGYPNDRNMPIYCRNSTSAFGDRQQKFYCRDFKDGTSGGPFVTAPADGGSGTVVGVIGGHEEGGLTPDVSYSVTFGDETRALYDAAVVQSRP